MPDPISVRLSDDLHARLKERSRRDNVPASTLVQRYVDEGLRIDRHPGIVFRDGPAGRRAGLARGPDVWEIASLIKHLGATGQRAIAAASRASGLAARDIRTAVAYWADHREEIDREVESAEADSRELEERTRAQQELLG